MTINKKTISPFICSKEKELAVMMMESKYIKETIKDVAHKLDKNTEKLDTFIDDIRNNYATKKELASVEKRLIEYNRNQDKKYDSFFDFIKSNWLNMLLAISMIVFVMIYWRG